jgi:hypothetical protein
VSADPLVQSGLRASTATIPNGIALPTDATVNVSAVQQLRPGTQVRLDILNLADATYQCATTPMLAAGRHSMVLAADPGGHHAAVLRRRVAGSKRCDVYCEITNTGRAVTLGDWHRLAVVWRGGRR